jgi:FMN phosphatase YigB (HAD superfamily)
MISVYSAINDSLWKKLERKEIERSVLLYHRFELFCERYGYVADAKKIAADYVKTLGTKGYMLAGAEDMLKKLYGKVKMYIVTNGVESVQCNRYIITGLSKYFDGI